MVNFRRWIKAGLVGLLLVFSLVLTVAFVSPNNRYFEIVKNLDIFATLFVEVNKYYVDEVNPSQLISEGVGEMLGELDPYTVYISEDKIEDFRTLNTGQYAGIGASTTNIEGRRFISMVYEGYAAYDNGLRIGDEIINVDGVKIAGLSQTRLNELVKGQAKTVVSLSVKRLSQPELIELKFEREKISIPNVPYSGMLENNIGFIKFTEFTPNGYKNVKKALQKLQKDGASGIILDLRGNLGGLLKEAVDISNLFIASDLEVVHTKGKVESSNFTYKTQYNPLAPEIPLVVLVNNMSASASEIVAGTLQDYDRAVLIGQKTYGKGLVQNTRDLPYNSKVKMTIAKYYIPSGRCIQAVDYSHRNPDGSVGKMPDSLKVAFQTKNGRKVYDGGGIDPEIILENVQISDLTRQLVVNGYIFRYASEYANNHESIVSASDLNLSDDEYADFIEWIEEEEFTYTNPLTEDLAKLEKSVDESSKKDQVSPHIKDISDKLTIPLNLALQNNSAEIRRLLEVDIASRYYLEPGAVEAGLGDDPSIKKALMLFSSPDKYEALLAADK
ncbi:MAG: peptidase S41 [Bacteroidetes bacterium]|nr:MAG: peptidase S41 [Bacteroidota bacterium]